MDVAADIEFDWIVAIHGLAVLMREADIIFVVAANVVTNQVLANRIPDDAVARIAPIDCFALVYGLLDLL